MAAACASSWHKISSWRLLIRKNLGLNSRHFLFSRQRAIVVLKEVLLRKEICCKSVGTRHWRIQPLARSFKASESRSVDNLSALRYLFDRAEPIAISAASVADNHNRFFHRAAAASDRRSMGHSRDDVGKQGAPTSGQIAPSFKGPHRFWIVRVSCVGTRYANCYRKT